MSKRRQDPEGAECVWWGAPPATTWPMSDHDLDEIAAWCRSYVLQPRYHGDDKLRQVIMPSDLERERGLGWNQSCAILVYLEKRGVLEKVPGTLAWRPAPPPIVEPEDLSWVPSLSTDPACVGCGEDKTYRGRPAMSIVCCSACWRRLPRWIREAFVANRPDSSSGPSLWERRIAATLVWMREARAEKGGAE